MPDTQVHTSRKRPSLSSRMITVILVVMMVAGLLIMLYPSVSAAWNKRTQSRAVASYQDEIASVDTSAIDEALARAYDYNRRLVQTGFRMFPTEEEIADYESQLNILGDGMMGYVEIPTINVLIPIYHGTAEEVLQIAVGHLEPYSLPVGTESFDEDLSQVTDPEEGSHCVLSGHRGLPSARLFTDIDQLVEGDLFVVTVMNERFTYEVDQIRVVLPTDLSQVQLEKGKDYCTLLTCTPYGVNTHRLLVRGHRVPNQLLLDMTEVDANAIRVNSLAVAVFIAAPILAILFAAAMIFGGRKREKGAWRQWRESRKARRARKDKIDNIDKKETIAQDGRNRQDGQEENER